MTPLRLHTYRQETDGRLFWSTGAIDDLSRTLFEVTDDEKRKEGKTIVGKLAELKYELQHNRKLTPLEDDGESDIAIYNKELEERGGLVWFNAPWLYTECYLCS
ncbi:DUF89 domain-containing protein [Histoplasma capsulatum H143]|uniref:Sugar phosphate phosphatase n=1 Tax=Ajellomyces capsulatus (strain H143) TaxID=544712 RepID=C6HPR8_AJECH|nr:DUF89 domain-containing protein [Histoplasma capsulatum H143]